MDMDFGSWRELEAWETDRLLQQATFCRVAFADGVQPYLLPMVCRAEKTPGGGWLFRLTSRRYGMKMQYLEANRRVALEFERQTPDGVESVVAFGLVRFHLPPTEGGKAEWKVEPFQISGRYYGKENHPEE